MKKRPLSTFDEVVRELGGAAAVARLVGRRTSAVCNWKRERERFPTTLYFVMHRALVNRGVTAVPALWQFEREEMPAATEEEVAAA